MCPHAEPIIAAITPCVRACAASGSHSTSMQILPLHAMTRWQAVFFPLLLLTAGITQAQTTAAPQKQDEFTFQFLPPTSTRVTTAYRLQKTRTVEGQPQVKDETESTSEGVFKRVGDGFEYSQKTLAVSMQRNGSPVNDPLLGLLAEVRPTFTISAEGAATQITGFANVEALVKSRMPPQVAAALAPVLNEAALVGRERAEWNARYADFAGGKFRIGDSIDVEAPQPLPTGETLMYTIRTTFPRWEPCPAGRCIRLEQVYESDAAALLRLSAGVVQTLAAAASAPASAVPVPEPAKSAARVSGSLSRLIDPGTMLIYSERVERVLTMQLQVPGKGMVPVTQQEVRTYAHSYGRQ
jgi:hypothetical protein